jgi:hypothetical protein
MRSNGIARKGRQAGYEKGPAFGGAWQFIPEGMPSKGVRNYPNFSYRWLRCGNTVAENCEMIDLLGDLNQRVARSAARALGQIGRIEARPMLAKLLRDEPSGELIDAVSSIADEECMVQLGRIARTEPALSDAALNALEDSTSFAQCDSDNGSQCAAATALPPCPKTGAIG